MENNNSQDLIQSIRSIIYNYNYNQRMYHLNNLDYNRNMTTLLNRMEIIQNQQIPQYRNPPSSNNTYYNNNRDNTDYNNLVIRLIQQMMHPNNINGLSNEQINIYTQNIHYTNELNEPRCPITYENFEENEEICQIIHCGHYFKKNAIYRWFQISTVCPVCRHDLTGNINNNENAINNNIIDPSLNNFFFSMYNDNFSDNLISTSFENDGSGNRIYNFEFPMYFPPNI